MKFKTIKWNTGSAATRFRLKNKKKKKRNKGSSSQAGGPAHKEPGSKRQAIQETVPYNDIEEAQG